MSSAFEHETLMQAGLAFHGCGDFHAAALAFAAVLDRDPDNVAARVNLANALWSQGAMEAARREAEAAIAAMPALAEAWITLGAIEYDSGAVPRAVHAYGEACRLKPHAVAAQAGLAAALLAGGEAEAALEPALAALALDPVNAHAMATLGAALNALGRPEAAIAAYDKGLAADPGNARMRLNRGNALLDLDRIDEAEAEIRAAIALAPGLKEAHASIGFLLTIRADGAGAKSACRAALAIDPDFAVAHWNLGVAALLEGDFTEGFAEYEWRKRHPVFGRAFTRGSAPEWTGEALTGRHLLVRAEQGLGDTIMLARFLPALEARAGRVTLQCPPCLAPLLRQLGIEIIVAEAPPPAHDLAVDQMSLPYLLGLTRDTIPNAEGYLAAEPARLARWEAILPRRQPGQKRVGLVWAGNPLHHNDRRRSLPPGALKPLLARQDISFVSLQMGARTGEYPVVDIAPLLTDFGETAAVVASLDAVVTVDSSVAHLTGALGVPCHILLPAVMDWRWQFDCAESPWYASVVLHRQRVLGDWSGPIHEIMAAI